MINIYQRKWGKLTKVFSFNSTMNELYMSSGGVLTVRSKFSKGGNSQRLVLSPGEWVRAVDTDVLGGY